MKKENIRKISYISVFSALAIIFSYCETLIPSIGIPGVKLGLANILIITALYMFSFKEALFISLLRVLITSLLIGNIFQMGFLMSLVGALLSLIIMMIAKNYFKKLSIIGVSILGSIFHVSGQILIATIYIGSIAALYYYPIILLSSLITGIIVGIISSRLIKIKFNKGEKND